MQVCPLLLRQFLVHFPQVAFHPGIDHVAHFKKPRLAHQEALHWLFPQFYWVIVFIGCMEQSSSNALLRMKLGCPGNQPASLAMCLMPAREKSAIWQAIA